MSRGPETHSDDGATTNSCFAGAVLVVWLVVAAWLIHSSRSNDRGSIRVAPWTGSYLAEDREILKEHFPDYVLPSERERLDKQLVDAIESNDEPRALQLLDRGASPHWMGPDDAARSDTRAPLFRAIRRGNPRIVEALLERGTRGGLEPRDRIVHRRNQFSQTPLYVAARCGNRDVVDVLLKHGASVNWSNGYGKTPVVGAIESGDVDMLLHLLECGGVCDFESGFASDRIPTHSVSHKAFG